eukprot:CAMPEP_0174831500 /NCGR_PEP_ID=MMETSP1114-20130205/3129_1 /TAXON_ID=312471 /ORGANISM="Neobodo designis, Strain CCAP 1951/1" /LENGTH=224 /DNA_ID=CAMNT_0016065325 /DNA_START=64 /DNA_END=738 /DNA_ORIENTATION=+
MPQQIPEHNGVPVEPGSPLYRLQREETVDDCDPCGEVPNEGVNLVRRFFNRIFKPWIHRDSGETTGSVYLALIAAMESVVLVRMWVKGIHAPIDPLLQGIVGPANKDNFSFKLVVSWLQSLLIAARWWGSRSVCGFDVSHRHSIIALHATEAVFILPLFITNFWPVRHQVGKQTFFGSWFICCGILADPFILTALLTTRQWVPAKKGGCGSPTEARDKKSAYDA